MAKRLLKTLLLPLTVAATALAFIACDGGTSDGKHENTPDKKYKVTYEVGADATGTPPTETDKAAGEKFKLKSADGITYEGKTFAGWNDGSLTYNAGDEYTMPSNAVTFTAQWGSNGDDPVTYSVTYNLNGGTGETPAQSYKGANEKFNLASADGISYEGKEFDGWSDGENKYAAGAEYTMSDKPVVFTAQWKDNEIPVTYTVTYKAGEHGTGEDVVISNVPSGTYSILYDFPFVVENFYRFNGWKAENDDAVSNRLLYAGNTYTLTGDAVFVAQYENAFRGEDNDWTSRIDLDFKTHEGGFYILHLSENSLEYVTLTFSMQGSTITITPAIGTTCTGTFINNVLNIAITVKGKTYTYGDLSAAVKHSVTYVIGDGASGTVPTETDKAKGEKFNLASAAGLTNGGKVFDGWYDGKNKYAAGAEYTMSEKAVTFTAQWKNVPMFNPTANIAVAYNNDNITGTLMLNDDGTGTIIIYTGDYDCLVYNDLSYTYSYNAFTITDSTVVDSDYASARVSTPVTGTTNGRNIHITLTVGQNQYEFQDRLYKMTITNNIPNSDDIIAYYSKDIPVGLLYPIDSNYEQIKVDGEIKDNAYCENFTMPEKDVVVEYVYHIYTIVYKANGGNGEDYTDYVTTPNSYTLIRNYQIGFSRDDYTLAGWTVNETDYAQGARIILTGDNTEVIARWNRLYTVSYAGVDNPAVETNFDSETSTTKFISSATAYRLPYGKKQFLAANIYFTRAGYTLKGWTSSADIGTANEGAIYDAGSYYTLTQDTTFTAVWEQITYYTVTYDLGGGTGTLPIETNKAEGERFDLAAGTGLANGDKVFDGWSDGTNKYAAGAEYTMPNGNVTLTAQWKDASSGGEDVAEKTFTGSLNVGIATYTQITINTDTLAYAYAGFQSGDGTATAVAGNDRAFKIKINGEDFWILISEDNSSLQIFDWSTMDVDSDLQATFTRQA
ncbi:MAG: InlB B-repeat-containing protein [Clostridiales bacterium]|nr:InlB B-repeat-containing protein [Clostridiales bacterium]